MGADGSATAVSPTAAAKKPWGGGASRPASDCWRPIYTLSNQWYLKPIPWSNPKKGTKRMPPT